MSDYFQKSADFVERSAVSILRSCGVQCRRNNTEDITAVDIITDSGIGIDAQFSASYAKYGDYRLDIVSAFTPANVRPLPGYKYDADADFLANFAKKYSCVVNKPGKLFQRGYLDSVIILFYNDKFCFAEPDAILLINRDNLEDFVEIRNAALFEMIRINNKSGLDDRHGSAFLPVNVARLRASCECLFGSMQWFTANGELVNNYLRQARR